MTSRRGQYVANIRLTAARQLLESSDKPLVDIAQETGFYDLSHFSRTFKKECGKTPGQYRRDHLKIRTRALVGPARTQLEADASAQRPKTKPPPITAA